MEKYFKRAINKIIKLGYSQIDFLRHLIFLNKHPGLKICDKIFTHLTLTEKRLLFHLASQLSPGSYALEIGSYLGASACFIASGLKPGSKLICIDTWFNDAMTEGKRDTEKEFDQNIEKYKDKIIKIKGYSSDVVSIVKEITSTIDLLFIDGDHSYKAVKTDWELYRVFLKKGSFVVFHDIGWAEGVIKVVNEDVIPYLDFYESLPNMFWGRVK